MNKEFIISEDGSTTIYIPELNEHYHSHFGAIQESTHIFINNGLKTITKQNIRILEIGLGTGLNAFLTYITNDTKQTKQNIDYTSIEAYPLTIDEIAKLNFTQFYDKKYQEIFLKIHESPSETPIPLSSHFLLHKKTEPLQNYTKKDKIEQPFDIIYFDAFGPDIQPELWTTEIFTELYKKTNNEGFLITYSCKGEVKRALKASGYEITKLPGPKGKREITKAIKKEKVT